MVSTHSLSYVQTFGLLAWSVCIWLVDIVKIRYAGPFCYANSRRQMMTFVGTILLTYALVFATEQLIGASSKQRLTVSMVASLTTLVIHGITTTWFPSVYENESVKKTNPRLAATLSRAGSGWILYGTGLYLFMALVTY